MVHATWSEDPESINCNKGESKTKVKLWLQTKVAKLM